MTILAIWGFILGTVFGRLFRVWILVPAIVAIGMIVVVTSSYYGHGLLHALFQIAVLDTCMQIGYLSGLFSSLIPSLWQRPRNSRNSTGSAASISGDPAALT